VHKEMGLSRYLITFNEGHMYSDCNPNTTDH